MEVAERDTVARQRFNCRYGDLPTERSHVGVTHIVHDEKHHIRLFRRRRGRFVIGVG